MKYQRPLCDHWYGRNEPTISYVALVQIKARRLVDNKFGILTYFLLITKKFKVFFLIKNLFKTMTNMWSFPAYIPGRILGVIKRAVQGRKFRIVEQIIRIISSTQLIVHLILIRIDLGLLKMFEKNKNIFLSAEGCSRSHLQMASTWLLRIQRYFEILWLFS